MNEQDVRGLLVQHRTELQTIQAAMNTALNQVKEWQTHPEQQPNAIQLQHHKEIMLMGYAQLRILQGGYEELLGLLQRLMQRHESAKAAYETGWDDSRIDIAARTTGEEYALLCRLLDRIDSEDGLPF